MADNLAQDNDDDFLDEEQEKQEKQEMQEFDYSQYTEDPQDSLAINRARAAYGKKTTQAGLRERRTPQRVITSDYVQEDPYEADDIDDDTIIAPDKKLINKTYKYSSELKEQKSYTTIAESDGGSDVLSLQTSDKKSGQTISFKVKGIQWKSGYSSEFHKTPLGHAMYPIPLPHPNQEQPDSLKKTGIVIRPVNPKLQKVLGQLLPSAFKKEMSLERKKRERLKQLSIFYLPSPQSSSVGFIHEFIVPRSDGKDAFYLYIQTSVGKAPVAILDEVLKTLEAGLPEGEKADTFDYTEQEEQDVILPEPDYKLAEEVNEAMKQVSSTFSDSIVAHSMKQGFKTTQHFLGDFMKQFDKYLGRSIRVLAAIVLFFMNSLPMKIFVQGLRILAKGFVKIIWSLNKVLLAFARSPVTSAILKVIGKGFSLLIGLISAIFSGLAYFFRLIGRGIAVTYNTIAELVSDPLNFNMGISFPAKKINFDLGEKREKSPLKIKAVRKASVSKPTVKKPPIQKQSSISVGQAKLRQVTKNVPAPPKLKGGASSNYQKIPDSLDASKGGRVVSSNSVGGKPVGGGNDPNKTPGNSPLGYFEDEPF